MANQRKSRARTRRRRSAGKQPSGFSWATFGAGMVVGIGLTVTGALLPEFLAPDETPETTASEAPASAEEPISFKFYDELPRARVNADTRAYEALSPHSGSNASFILQAGSFSNREDADRLRGQLLLTNLNVKVETVTLPSGSTAHRVMVGPFDSEQDTARAMTRLREENIDPLKLALKAPSH